MWGFQHRLGGETLPNVRDIDPLKLRDATERKFKAELKRLQDLTRDSIPRNQRTASMPMLHNLAWQKVKLEEARADLMADSIFIPYDNGGGQTGIREHPGYTAYNKLFSTYARGIKQLCDMMHKGAPERDEMLDFLDETRQR